MTATVKFLGKYAYQIDLVRPRHRTPERFDVVADTQYEIPSLEKSDLTPGAAVIRIRGERGRIHDLSFDGWNGALWSPLGNVADDLRPHHTPITFDDYRIDFHVNWARNSNMHCDTDPLRRAYMHKFGPTERGLRPRHLYDCKTTLDEKDIVGRTIWSNRTEAAERHHDAVRDLIRVDGIMYVRRPDPIWAIMTNPDKTRTAELSIPKFLLSSEADLIPQTYSGLHLHGMTSMRADRHREALNDGTTALGEILALDPNYLSRDDATWALFCRLDVISERILPLFGSLPASVIPDVKLISDAGRNATPWNMSPISDRKDAILRGLRAIAETLPRISCRTDEISKRSHAVQLVAAAIEQCSIVARPEPPFHPDDDTALAGIAIPS